MGLLTLTTPPPSSKRAAHSILERGFAELPIDAGILVKNLPPIRDGIRDIVDDKSVHDIFATQIVGTDEMGWEQEAGLVRRSDKENKFFFHYQSPPAEWPFPQDRYVEYAKRFMPFFEACGDLTAEARRIAESVARALDQHLNPGEHRLTQALVGARAVTRILRYLPLDGEKEGNPDAYAHLDRGLLTIHWWASDPGLVIFDNEEVAHRVEECRSDMVAVFPGKKFFGMTGGTLGMKGIHGVRDAREARSHDRIAVVTFVHANLTPEAIACIHANKQAFKDAEHRCAL